MAGHPGVGEIPHGDMSNANPTTIHAPNSVEAGLIDIGKLNRNQPIAPLHFPTISAPTAQDDLLNAQPHVSSHTLAPPPILNDGVNVYNGVTDSPYHPSAVSGLDNVTDVLIHEPLSQPIARYGLAMPSDGTISPPMNGPA